MFYISDGRDEFYQWDVDRRIVVEDETVNEVHFCNKTDDCSLVCEVCEEDGIRYTNVPNILLQDTWDLNIYGYDINYTKHSARFAVLPRTKPYDYVYTETEIFTYHRLEKRLDEIEENGISDEQVEKVINGYFEKNPIEIPETDLTGYATEPYVWTAVGELQEYVNDSMAELESTLEVELEGYARITDIPNMDEYATEDYVEDAIEGLSDAIGVELKEYAKVEDIPDISGVDLSNYYTKEEIDALIPASAEEVSY